MTDSMFSKESLAAAFEGNPFDLKPPTRRAFPGGIAEAVRYYESHLATCVAAESVLTAAADHVHKLAHSARAAAEGFAQLTAAELETFNIRGEFGRDLSALADKVSPHHDTFSQCAAQYAKQRELLERTIEALKAAL